MQDTPDRLLTPAETLELLNVTRTALSYWTNSGYIPHSRYAQGHHKYPTDFIHTVLRLSQSKAAMTSRLRLCLLVWHIETGSASERQAAWRQLRQLRSEGKIAFAVDAAKHFGHSYKSVVGWIRRGSIPGLRTGRFYLILDDDVRDITKVLNGYTAQEVADILGVSLTVVFRLHWSGRLKGTLLEHRLGVRFSPEEVERVKAERETKQKLVQGMTSATDAARKLNVHRDTLAGWEAAGVLKSRRFGQRRYYDTGDIERLYKMRSTLSPGFDWLQLDNTAPCYSNKQLARRFNVTTTATTIWIKDGLPLPFFNLTPPPIQLPERRFPCIYIDALISFAGLPVTRKKVKDYYALCLREQDIVTAW